MQVRIFKSEDIASGLKMVKDELGPDALILSTKTIRSGKLGLLSKKYFEITAAVDTMWPHKGGTAFDKSIKHESAITTTDNKIQDDTPLTYNSSLQVNRRTTPDNQEVMPVVPVQAQPQKTVDQTDLQIEVSELKGMIKNLGQEMLRLNTSNRVPTVPSGSDSSSVASESSLRSLQQRLLDYGISSDTAQTISSLAKESLTLEELSDPFKQQQYVAEKIQERIQVNTDIFKEIKRQHRVALVGPTGVGKTTTLAKIAARFLVKHSPNIAFITIDTYRIAAVEQLKVYGEIMNIPVEVVLSPEQLENALLKFRDKDLVLIDTAGRSPQDSLSINELASFLRPELSIEKHLVLSATTRENELFDTMQRFSILGIDNTIITKTDECTSLGLLLDIQTQEEVPFSYITNGQRVPEDIMEANKETLAQLIMSPGKGLAYE